MKVEFRSVPHTYTETAMCHKIWFRRHFLADTISATANPVGYSTLKAIARTFSWNPDLIKKAAHSCNERNEVAIVTAVTPRLLLVPRTRRGYELFRHNGGVYNPRSNTTRTLTEDLMNAANEIGTRVLHFSHFGFIQGRVPSEDITSVLREMGYYSDTSQFKGWKDTRRDRGYKQQAADSRRKTSIETVIWDYDFRRGKSIGKVVDKAMMYNNLTREISRAEAIGVLSLLPY